MPAGVLFKYFSSLNWEIATELALNITILFFYLATDKKLFCATWAQIRPA